MNWPKLSLKQLSIGMSGMTQLELTEEVVLAFAAATGYETSSGEVPPGILSIYRPLWEALGGRAAEGTVHLRQSVAFHTPLTVGDKLDFHVSVQDIYQKKERDYVVFQVLVKKAERLMCEQLITYIWGLVQTSDRKGV